MSNETNEILTIAGKRVEKRYTPSENELDRCMKCCLHNSIECEVYLSTYAKRPCEAYHKRGGYAYFVPAEESEPENWPADKDNLIGRQAKKIEGTPQKVTLIPSNEDADKALPKVIYCGWNGHGNLSYSNTKALPNMRPYVPAEEIEGTPQEVTLIPSNKDEDKAAMDYYLNLPNSSYGEGGNLLPCAINEAFKAGVAWVRERIMKGAVQGEVVHINGFPTLENVVLPSEFLRVQPGSKVKLIILK